MTRRDRDRGRSEYGGRDADFTRAMRDSYDYIHGRDRNRGSERDVQGTMRDVFGSGRDLLGLLVGGGIVGLTSGLLGTDRLGNSGIPMAIVPAAVGYAASYFEVAGPLNRDLKNAASGALIGGFVLWAAGRGILIQQNRQQQVPATMQVGSNPAATVARDPRIGACPPHVQAQQQYLPAPGMQQAYSQTPSESPLSEAELISIAQRY